MLAAGVLSPGGFFMCANQGARVWEGSSAKAFL